MSLRSAADGKVEEEGTSLNKWHCLQGIPCMSLAQVHTSADITGQHQAALPYWRIKTALVFSTKERNKPNNLPRLNGNEADYRFCEHDAITLGVDCHHTAAHLSQAAVLSYRTLPTPQSSLPCLDSTVTVGNFFSG